MEQIVCLIYHTTAYKGGRCEDNSGWCVEVTCQCSAKGEVSRLINPLPYRWYSRWCERFRNYQWMSASVIRAAIEPYNTIVAMCQEEVYQCLLNSWISCVMRWLCLCTSLYINTTFDITSTSALWWLLFQWIVLNRGMFRMSYECRRGHMICQSAYISDRYV